MIRHLKRRNSAGVNLGFQIAPMIDVVFVIMLFFMVMAGAVKTEGALKTQIPGTKGPMENFDEIAIRVDDDGQVYFNDDALDGPDAKKLPELTASLTELKQASDATHSEMVVTVYADEHAKYERVIDVLDALSRAKITKVTFQAADPE